METQRLSVNDIKLLVKQNLYRLETGAKRGDSLVYDRESGKYVGHIDSAHSFYQDSQYTVPTYIVSHLETFNGNDWDKKSYW